MSAIGWSSKSQTHFISLCDPKAHVYAVDNIWVLIMVVTGPLKIAKMLFEFGCSYHSGCIWISYNGCL